MKRSRSHLSGIALMCKASFAFSLMALCVKFASQTLPSLEIVFFRSLIGALMILTLIRAKKVSLFGKEKFLMILRGLCGFAALSLHFYTIARLPLGTAVLLNYTGPIFASLFAVFFLKEKPGILLFAMALISFTGVYFLTQADFRAAVLPFFLALLSGVFVGIVYVLIRAIRRRESPLTVIFYFTAVSTAGSLGFLPFGFKWPGLYEWLLLAGVGAGSFYGQLWMTTSLRRAPAALVSPFSYLAPLLSFVYGFIFFGEEWTFQSAWGAFLIILGGSLISYFETLPVSKKNSKLERQVSNSRFKLT